MKFVWIIGICLVAGTATAQVFKPVTSGQMADVNGMIIQPGDLNLKTLPYQPYQTGEAPVTGKWVAHKSADVRMVHVNVLDLPQRSSPLIPQQNFSAKRASSSDQRASLPDSRPAAERLPAASAPIRKRVIQAQTPAGEQELREQLEKLPAQADGK